MTMTVFIILASGLTNQRRGQAYWNIACEQGLLSAEEMRQMNHTDLDPFHDDDRIPAFFTWLVENGRLTPTV